MPIAKKPQRDQSVSRSQQKEQAAQAFISGAGKQEIEEKEAGKKPVMVRFDPDLLARVDEAAKRRGVSRAAWIQFTLSRALDAGEG
jgi:predicted HicB family RNase H-like nuclease